MRNATRVALDILREMQIEMRSVRVKGGPFMETLGNGFAINPSRIKNPNASTRILEDKELFVLPLAV